MRSTSIGSVSETTGRPLARRFAADCVVPDRLLGVDLGESDDFFDFTRRALIRYLISSPSLFLR